MSLLKEKEKTPAVTVRADVAKALLAKQNVQKPSPIRKAWKFAKAVVTLPVRYPFSAGALALGGVAWHLGAVGAMFCGSFGALGFFVALDSNGEGGGRPVVS